jgi:type IV secretory pathway TraG/TraD family ATPase VirD4
VPCVDALNRFLSNDDKVLASILATFHAPLTIWANPIVDAATSANDFDLRDVRAVACRSISESRPITCPRRRCS